MSARAARIVVLLMTLGVFGWYFFLFEGVGLDYWDTYIAAPATFVAGKPCVFVDESDAPAYAYELRRRLPHDLIGRDSYGIVSQDQRLGAGVTFAPVYLIFGVAGFRMLYALFGAFAFYFSYAAGRRLLRGHGAAILLGLLVALNPFMLAMNRLNANFIAVGIMAGLLALLAQEKPRWWMIGLVYGALGGIRNEAIMMAPALCVLLLATRERRKAMPSFTGGALLGIAPYLAWNRFAFGKMLIHSSQFSDFDGWRPVFPHRLLGWEFEFNGLLNWPFHDHLVRTPHYPFPTYLPLPLTLILCFGVLWTALGCLGWFAAWRERAWGAFLTLWIVFSFGLFLFQENWEEPKTTFGALIIVPLALFMVRGLVWLAEKPRATRRWASLLALVVLLEAGIYSAADVRVPVDERWYVRFPKAKTEAVRYGCLADEQRREWMFFHTDECPAELAEQRAKLTRGNLLPNLYYPLRLQAPDLAAEFGRKQPHLFDIWNRIYGF